MNSKLLSAIGVGLITIAVLMSFVAQNRDREIDKADLEIEDSIIKLNRTFKLIRDPANRIGAKAGAKAFKECIETHMKHYINSDHHPVRKAQCRQLAEALQDFLSDLARSSLSIREFRAETGCLPGEGAQCLVYFVSRFTLIGINDLEERFGEQTDEANRNRAFVIRNVEIFYHDREKLNHRVPYMAEPRSGLIKKEGRTLSYICVSLGGISLLAGLGTARFNRLDIKKGTS